MQFLLCRTLMQFLAEPLVLIGLVLIALGIATAFLARRIARVARQSNNIANNDKVFLFFKILGLLMVATGFVLTAIDVVTYILSR